MKRRVLLALAAAVAVARCGAAPDPKQTIEATDLDGFWGVEASSGNEQYIAPMCRVRLRNKGTTDLTFVRAMATFRREGSNDAWGSDFKFVTSGDKPLRAGESIFLEFKSEARYHSPGTPESMFSNTEFKDARVEIFVRLASSEWVEVARSPLPRRIGSKTAQTDPNAPTPAAVPSHN